MRPHSKNAYVIPFDIEPCSYEEALAHIRTINKLGISPMLEVVIEMLDELERPDSYYDIIQVAGTNGKTSTSRFCAALLRAHGLDTALYTSPELVDIRDRLEINGKRVEKDLFAIGVTAAKEAGRRVNARRRQERKVPYDVTEFDTITVASLVVAALFGIDVCVLEVGMGGRWDATSATNPLLTCITGIALDHTHILGDTVEKIAPEKAAIIKQGQRACVLGPKALEPPSVRDVFLKACKSNRVEPYEIIPVAKGSTQSFTCKRKVCLQAKKTVEQKSLPPAHCIFYEVLKEPDEAHNELSVRLHTPVHSFELSLPLPSYQAPNIAAAVALTEQYVASGFSVRATVDALKNCPLPGRFQTISCHPLHIIDAAHNVESLSVTLEEVRRRWPHKDERPLLLCAIFKDKQVMDMVTQLSEVFPNVVVTQTQSPRALSSTKLAGLFYIANAHVVAAYERVEDALVALKNEDYIALGTITLAGSALAFEKGLPLPNYFIPMDE